MEDLFKKFINAGVGFVSLTNERVQGTIDKLVKESKLSEQEGAKIMDDLKKNTDAKRKELEKQLQGLSSKLMKSVGVAPNADVEELKRTVKGNAKSSSSSASSSASAKGSASSSKAAGSSSAKPAAAKASATKSASTASKSTKASGSTESKANKTAAKKAISPNDNTSSSGSQLS
ncbi:hypothetical protein GCM10027346_30050 [Hymenobacter seoulensis]